jgi:toxin secretion/phage lysis holin
MDNKLTDIKIGLTAVGAFLSSILGILYVPVLLMVLCNIIDYITGLVASVYRGEKVSSYVGLKGIIKKVCLWLLVVVGAIMDTLIRYAADTVGITPPIHFLIACVVAMWIICNELISILENMVDIGVKIPPFLLPLVTLLKEQAEKAGEPKEEG